MDKQSILIMLGSYLDEYGVPEDEILKNVKMFERYLSSLTPEEYKKEVENVDVELIANNIYGLIQKKSSPSKEIKKDMFEDIPITEDEEFSNIYPIENKPKTELTSKTVKMIPVQYEQVKNPQPIDLEALDDIPAEELPYVRGTPAFWAIFILTLPLTLPIIVAIFAVFFAVITSLAVLIVSLIGTLIGIVAAGSALALIGIVYGVTQTFSTLPVGLYEMGLGVLIGGVAMFTGILIYNFAVRFLPFAIKHIIVFMKFTIKKIKYLFYYLKKESTAR